MKVQLYTIKGEKKKEIELPDLFSTKIREDVAQKYYEVFKFSEAHPYAPYLEAGKRHSASGTISHRRHKWKGHYGRAISRAPRKTMRRRGTQFFWVGAEVSGARGGRRAHPPRTNKREGKINQKEVAMAMRSALAATTREKYLSQRYSSLNKLNTKMPIILESISNIKTKDFINFLKTIIGEAYKLALKNKSVRAGKGKLRGRKYKSNAGILLIKSKDERIKMKGIDIKSANELKILDLYPLGRLAIFTEKSLGELK